MSRPLYEIAAEIKKEWTNPYFGAVPYIGAMKHLESIKDRFLHDDARDIVLRFLSNASTWRGPIARRVKAELKEILKG